MAKVNLTDKELGLIWDALSGRYVMFNRAGEHETALEYDKLRNKVGKIRLRKVM